MRLNETCLNEYIQSLGSTLGDELIKPTRIYAKAVLSLRESGIIKSAGHITGGGFMENVPRMLPNQLGAQIKRGSWNKLPIFDLIQWQGELSEQDMFGVFNMGIGMILAVSPENVDTAVKSLKELGEEAFVIGEAVSEPGVNIC
jgi:phosphoribosylformylglycinamidine cyclo-ligase